jgi:hypothetical protein
VQLLDVIEFPQPVEQVNVLFRFHSHQFSLGLMPRAISARKHKTVLNVAIGTTQSGYGSLMLTRT